MESICISQSGFVFQLYVENNCEVIHKGDHFFKSWGHWNGNHLACGFPEALQRESLGLSSCYLWVLLVKRSWRTREHGIGGKRHRRGAPTQAQKDKADLKPHSRTKNLNSKTFENFPCLFVCFFQSFYFAVVTSRKISKSLKSQRTYVITFEEYK